MLNLNAFGKKFLAVYLRDYAAGRISFNEARANITCCFNDRSDYADMESIEENLFDGRV